MNLFRLILQNIRFYKRSWLVTLAGAVIGTAVLTGALVTGDSVRNSLREMVSLRLGTTRFALAPADRFFRQALAGELESSSGFQVLTVLRTHGIATEPNSNHTLNRVEIIGVNKEFPALWKSDDGMPAFMAPAEDEAVISENIAGRLKVKPGDFLVVKIPSEGFAPANAPFVSAQSVPSIMRLRVKGIAANRSGGNFSLDHNQSSPFNIFVSQKTLSAKMGMAGYSNTLLVSMVHQNTGADSLDEILRRTWTPEDAGLLVSEISPGISQLVSRRIFIEDNVAKVIRSSVKTATGILTYLVNDISLNNRSTPYSFVTAADPGIAPDEPGPGEIVINDWLASDLLAKPGDTLKILYFVMGTNHSLKEETAKFRVRSVIPARNSLPDRALMPDFPGMKNTGNCRDWETGTPIDLGRIREKDEAYWNIYKGTPKAWISMIDGQKIWRNPFGSITAFRFGSTSSDHALREAIHKIDPSLLGLKFTPVFEEGLRAAGNSTDFGELFLSLGGLIFIAGILLSAMLLSFFLRKRIEEITLMRSLGFRNRKIISIFLSETLIVSAAGGLLGVIAAIIYAKLIVIGLDTLWQQAVNTSGLRISIRLSTLFTGFIISLAIHLVVFSIILFRNGNRVLPSPYLQKEPRVRKRKGYRESLYLVFVAVLFISALVIILRESFLGRFYPSTAFMSSGIMILAGFLLFISFFLSFKRQNEMTIHTTISGYVLKNAMLQKIPTLTAIALLALGTFTILVTGLNRNQANPDQDKPSSGTGGFRFWMETTLPVYDDLNTKDGRKKAGLEDEHFPANLRFVPLPGISGDDASCLNLNQVTKPALTGVPSQLFDQKGSFSFTNLLSGINRDHPWNALEETGKDDVINGYADQTVITWGLRKQIGDTMHYVDESGRKLNIRIAGGLENSVFQGRLLVSAKLLSHYFPSSVRIHSFLIDQPGGQNNSIVPILEERLHDQGAVITQAREKLANFESVENTYLDVFIMLGGFGLIIGTAGLAVLVMRNLNDRRRELALYAALGFPSGLTYRLFAGEFVFILLSGIFIGIISAFAGTLPSLIRGGAGALELPGLFILVVVINGFTWIHFLVKKTLNAFRKEPVTKSF